MSADEELRAAWDEFVGRLQHARDAINQPGAQPPPPSERVLAEGYRYLFGYVHGAIERAFFEDPDFPFFRRALHPIDKATIDNADALYLAARIDGNHTYRITARAADHRHWRGEPEAPTGPKAPQYVILEASTGYAGDTGELAELRSGVRAGTGKIDAPKLQVEEDGTFEILCCPERPDGHTGNFVRTRKEVAWRHPDGRVEDRVLVARYLTLRELFSDWGAEEALEVHICRVDREGEQPLPLDPAGAAARMRRAGEIVDHQMRFWNAFYTQVCEAYGDADGDGQRYLPLNDLNSPSRARLRTGGGQSTNVYAGGMYHLGPDEALIVTCRTPQPPAYMGFHLANLWGESLDYANHTSSLSGHQAPPDPDGARRYVIAHRDPGVWSWLDTTGVEFGYMTQRWSYPEPPEELPDISAQKVAFGEVRRHLPDDVRTATREERREQIRIRQRHVQRRFRQH